MALCALRDAHRLNQAGRMKRAAPLVLDVVSQVPMDGATFVMR